MLVALNHVTHLQTETVRQLLLVRRKDYVLRRVLREVIGREVMRRGKRLAVPRRHRNHQPLNLALSNLVQLVTDQLQVRRRLQPTHILNIRSKRRHRLLAGHQLRQ